MLHPIVNLLRACKKYLVEAHRRGHDQDHVPSWKTMPPNDDLRVSTQTQEGEYEHHMCAHRVNYREQQNSSGQMFQTKQFWPN